MSYFNFIWKSKRFLLFGFFLTLCSTIGQTSLLSVFTPHLQDLFSLSNAKIGTIYSLATLTSALAIILVGKGIDKMDLKKFTLLTGIGLIIGCASMALSTNLWMLYFSYLILRLVGQGLMTHISMVSMARYFDKRRGSALSIASFGYPIGDALFPLSVLFGIQAIGFQQTWWILAAVSLFLIVPFLLWLLKGHEKRHEEYVRKEEEKEEKNAIYVNKFKILTDWRFYFVSIGILAPGFINTGIFFQYSALVMAKGWFYQVFTSSFVHYALGSILGSFIFGLLVDRFKSVQLISFYLIPLMLGLLALFYGKTPVAIYLFMAGAGISQGASSVIISSVWSELFGTKSLGVIRSWVSSLRIIFTALSPVLFGFFLDLRVSMHTILFLCFLYTLFSIFILASVGIFHKKKNFLQKSLSKDPCITIVT